MHSGIKYLHVLTGSVCEPVLCPLTGPPIPSTFNVSVVMVNGVAELSVSWEAGPDVHGPVEYLVTSDQNLTCNSTSSSCILSPVSCGEVHTIQVTASNEAGPSPPSHPEVFITCKQQRFTLSQIHTVNIHIHNTNKIVILVLRTSMFGLLAGLNMKATVYRTSPSLITKEGPNSPFMFNQAAPNLTHS